jgi:septal ring-binding cell division protein DamX
MTDFYQSPGDKLRLDILLKTLSEGNLNLAILGEDDVGLAHYARRIAQHLRQNPAIEVELWSSADSEKLVQRFNEILSEVSVQDALNKTQKAATKRYMIFPDAQSIQEIDLQLLARLINGFPASNIHVILLVNSLEPHERKLAAFGKNLMQWVLESENPAPKRAQRIETFDEAAAESKSFEPTPPAFAASASLKTPDLEHVVPSAGSWETPQAPSAKGNSLLAWGVLLGLLVSLVVLSVLYQDFIQSEFEAMKGYLSRQTAGSAKETSSAASSSTVGMSSSAQLPVKPDDSLIPEKEALIKPEAVNASTAPTPGPEENKQVTVAPAPPTASATPAAAVAPPPPVAKSDPVPPPSDDRLWVDKLPASGWVLQHAAFDTQQEIELFQSKQAAFKDAKIIKTKRKSGAAYYILLTGPYATRQEAENLIKTQPAMAKSWLRAIKSIKTQLQD